MAPGRRRPGRPSDAWQPSHLDKVFFPDDGITKGDLLAYYETVAPALLPHLAGRPLNLERFPDGIAGPRIHQKQVPASAPAWLRTVRIYAPTARRTIAYAVARTPRDLAYLVNLGCIELHPWLVRADRPAAPDRVVFDLDPHGIGMAATVEVARRLRQALAGQGLRSYAKTSGGRGLHVVVPIRRGPGFDEVRAFADALAARLAAADPALATASRREADKAGRVYIDTLRNGPAQTMVAPYSVRARPGAPVSTPLDWDEVGPGLDPATFTLRTLPARLAARGDLFRPLLEDRQNLPRAAPRG
ncbi:MAG TPA: non-homologous end-joining DNA ligase [Thermodesulfobacteriota bacterium]|nr:non-homologous end-joining DNA ligase [Thermodesulfobacteriota bacterium]